MSKFLFKINDSGLVWRITECIKWPTDDYVVDPTKYHETPSEDFFEFVKILLDENTVEFLKNYNNSRVVIDSTAEDAIMIFQAVAEGASGDNVAVEIVNNGTSQDLVVNVSSGVVTISAQTDANGNIISTAIDVVNAVMNYPPSNAIIVGYLKGTGTAVVDEFPQTYLAGGASGEGDLTSEDLIIKGWGTLTVKKAEYRTLGKHSLKQRIDPLLLYDFFEFSLINNSLINQGHVITDANREEKYLEITNGGDDTLIAELEKYLEVRDRISEHASWYNSYVSYKSNVNASVTIEEIEELYNIFAAQFQ